ncbi:alpha/beta hydrolase [Flaviaesturariibacter amylovorans]|uniref:Alpha/beta fold hydrolase n=1 Tax=Flaviaesturariibacter amylovorans TaxID=1084520 RepID=A0ABP8GAT5_9BACT
MALPNTKMILLRTLQLLAVGYLIICIAVYLLQEKLIFFPERLARDHGFSFDTPFEERFIRHGADTLHGLHFKADNSKGLVFYLHGNAGSVNRWGAVAKRYTDLGWDVFLLDYPGYGKSGGAIRSKKQLLDAVQAAYDDQKRQYPENRIVVLGYSIGTGPAAWLASANKPKQLLLQAPYYSLADVMRHHYRILPTFLLKYNFETGTYLESCRVPVTLFHGDRDDVVPYGSSLKLQRHLKPGDTLITLPGQGHDGITDNPEYVAALRGMLR